MEDDYLKEAMLRVENELDKSPVAGFVRGKESPLLMKAIEHAISIGYLQQGGQLNGGIVIRSIKDPGKKYLKQFKAQI